MYRLLFAPFLLFLFLFSSYVQTTLAQGREDQPDFSNKAVLFPNGLSTEFSLRDYTQAPPYTAASTSDFTYCDTGACFNRVESAYTVTYNDGDTVKVCLCDNAVMPLNEMANKHGVVCKSSIIPF